jgi:hypothetical protein
MTSVSLDSVDGSHVLSRPRFRSSDNRHNMPEVVANGPYVQLFSFEVTWRGERRCQDMRLEKLKYQHSSRTLHLLPSL